MTRTATRSFKPTLEGLGQATEFLDEFCMNPRIAVVLDELASNVVRCSGATEFTVRVSQGEELSLEIFDDGNPFDPTKTENPDITASVDERDIGGLGLFMVKKMSKAFVYERTADGRNHVTVVMK